MGLWELTPKRIAWYLFWFGSNVGLFIAGFLKQKNDPGLALLNSIGGSVFSSRGAGMAMVYTCTCLLLPVCRNLIAVLRTTPLRHIMDFDDNIYFHKCAAYANLFWTMVHVNAHYQNFFIVELKLFKVLPVRAWQIHYTMWGGVTGHIMLVIMFLMHTSAKIEVRKRKFEVFWITHHLYFVYFILLFFHGYGCFVKTGTGECRPYYNYWFTVPTGKGECRPYSNFYYTVPVFVLYFLERMLREYRARQFTALIKVVFHPGNTMELQFEKPSFKYKPGQYLFINIPDVSRVEWHPFTITSTPEEGFVSIHIRIVGDWTRKASQLLGGYQSAKVLPTIRVDGPYGAPAEDFYNYSVGVLVGAGIGVTPSASLLKSVWYRYYRKAPMKLRKVYFFWINRDKEAFEWFHSLLATLEESVPTSFLEIHVYLTGKLSLDDIQNIVLNQDDEVDPLIELKTRCHYGRPNWDGIFAGVAAQNNSFGADEVGVFYCGPSPLAETLRKACRKVNSNGGTKFVFRKEKF
ncbi:ferric reductase NAD binding domain-containing protein [Cladochytrium replicatum]|nr:ferric reductase NAD binding domain-containing protein [Cladochytrium replicatum]